MVAYNEVILKMTTTMLSKTSFSAVTAFKLNINVLLIHHDLWFTLNSDMILNA